MQEIKANYLLSQIINEKLKWRHMRGVSYLKQDWIYSQLNTIFTWILIDNNMLDSSIVMIQHIEIRQLCWFQQKCRFISGSAWCFHITSQYHFQHNSLKSCHKTAIEELRILTFISFPNLITVVIPTAFEYWPWNNS